MSSQARFRRIDELFTEALELPTAERQAFLDRAAAGDEDLIREVHELLEQVANPLDLAEILNVAAVVRSPLIRDARAGQRLGPFAVTRKLGEGGMGSVWLGRRDDGLFEQDVAIKFILPEHFSSPAQQARFLRERRILAQLSHPNIARILDGGATAEREPYFIMEYVDGAPITRYCEANHLNAERRLSLWLQACDAVAYAHAKGVIHRDLKPGNILVTPDGIVKVLDFGIARSVGTAATLTATGAAWGTPFYSSPEQLAGGPTGVASDVYSLGAVLLELLGGKTALPASSSKSGGDTTEPLPRPLRSLVRRAMAPQPADRPSSVTEMSEEARAYQLDLQVARHGTWRRRWLALAAVATTLTAVIAGFLWWRLGQTASTIPSLDQLPWKQVTTVGDAMLVAVAPDRASYVMTRIDTTAGLTGPSLWLRRASSPHLAKVLDSGVIPGSFWFMSVSADEWVYISTSQSVLWRLPLLGGAPQRLRADVGAVLHSPDGRRCVYESLSGGQRLFQIADTDCATGSKPLLQLQPEGGSFMTFSSDSRTLVFVLSDDTPGGKRWTARIDVDSGTRETVFEIPPSGRVLRVAPLPNRAWLVNAYDVEAGVYGLWHWQEGRSIRVSNPAHGFKLSAQTGDTIFGVQETFENTLHEADVQRQTSRQISRGTGNYYHGHYLKNGRIVTRLRAGTSSEIWLLAPDGTPERQILQGKGPIGPIAVDADEREVFFLCTVGTSTSLWRGDLATGTQERVTPAVGIVAMALSPDGERIAYLQTAAGRYTVSEVLRRDPARVVWQASAAEHTPLYTPDSRSLLYLSGDVVGGRPMMRDVETGAETAIDRDPFANIVRWKPGPDAAFPDLALVLSQNRSGFDAFSRATSRRRPLWRLDASLRSRCWVLNPDLRADGGALLYTRACITSDVVSLQLP